MSANLFVFGYGSLMNPRSIAKTLPGEHKTLPAKLSGYRRKFNAAVQGNLYLNIIPDTNSVISGVLIPVNEEELEKLKSREIGYACVDVTSNVESSPGGRVFTFIGPDTSHSGLTILKSYINVCLAGVSKSDQESWLKDTIIENEIENDSINPKYPNI